MLLAQDLGVLLMISLPDIGSLIIGALLSGGGFLNVVQLTLECNRRQAPDHLRYMAGLLTCGLCAAVGQLVGPCCPRYPFGLPSALSRTLLALAVAGILE